MQAASLALSPVPDQVRSTWARPHADNFRVIDDDNTSSPSGIAPANQKSKPWLMVYFECCHCYGRLNRNRECTHYRGCCPKCGARVSARIGADGTGRRMFKAG